MKTKQKDDWLRDKRFTIIKKPKKQTHNPAIAIEASRDMMLVFFWYYEAVNIDEVSNPPILYVFLVPLHPFQYDSWQHLAYMTYKHDSPIVHTHFRPPFLVRGM